MVDPRPSGPHVDPYVPSAASSASHPLFMLLHVADDDMVKFKDCTLSWNPTEKEEEDKDLQLIDINLTAKKVSRIITPSPIQNCVPSF